MTDETDEVLRRLEERLERASGAAERLFSQAAAQATSAVLRTERVAGGPQRPGAGPEGAAETPQRPEGSSPGPGAATPPPQGWASAGHDGPRAPGDLELLITALEAVGELVPPDLRQRLGDAVREILLALRALIDWYLERQQSRPAQPPEVQDIPVL